MHGYFVDNRLYRKAQGLVQPFAYETYKQQRIQQKLEEERKSRISVVRKLPKVSIRAIYGRSRFRWMQGAQLSRFPASIARLYGHQSQQ